LGDERTALRNDLGAAIFLPVGFLTGLLGINGGSIPRVENPDASVGVVRLLVGIVIVELVVCRWRNGL
jgi:Mg2+ and Co2+ transporter CorA